MVTGVNFLSLNIYKLCRCCFCCGLSDWYISVTFKRRALSNRLSHLTRNRNLSTYFHHQYCCFISGQEKELFAKKVQIKLKSI